MPRRRREEGEEEKRPETVEVAYSPVNEQVVLAAALVDSEACERLLKKLRPEHFLVELYRAAWAALSEMGRRRLEFDWATLQQLGGDRVDTRQLQELVGLRPDAPAAANLDHHVQALYWDRQRAVAVQGPLSALLEVLRKPSESPDRVRALARQLAQSFDGTGAGYLRNASDLVVAASREMEKRISGLACYPFGIEGLDRYEQGARDEKQRDVSGRFRLIPGAAPGEVTVLTGTSGSGKSTVAFHVALGLRRAGRRVLFGAWEMGSEDSIELLACIELGWSRTDLLEGVGYGEQEKIEHEEKMHDLVTGPNGIVFFDNPFQRQVGSKPSTDRNLDTIHQHLADSGCEVGIFDLWERCLVSNDPGEEQRALWRQHAVAQETRTHCVLLAQQRLKDLEQRADKHPTREGIKGSSAWVDVADTILGVHRPALWKQIPDDRLEVDVLKQRKGKWPLRVEFTWDPEYGSVDGGRSVVYEQPGTDNGGNMSELFNMATPKSKKTAGGGRRR